MLKALTTSVTVLALAACGSTEHTEEEAAAFNSSATETTSAVDTKVTVETAEALVKGSDDFPRHGRAFARAAERLITDNECTAADFQEMGGFVKSQNQKSEPIYFTYCGGMTIANRIYLNAETGEIFR